MTDRELMQQALEALEDAHTRMEHYQDEKARERAITALRERLAQPEQEPVACPYCHNSATLGSVYYDQNCVGCVKRMTTPPRRKPLTWERVLEIGLECANDRSRLPFEVKVARAIEAAHGIKGDT